MKNERAKKKKQGLRNFIRTSLFLLALLFSILGVLFYMLIPDLPISPDTEKLLFLIISILSLAALFAWVFWHRPVFKKYTEEYEKEIEMVKSNRAFTAYLFVLILLGIGIGFGWYFSYVRPRVNAEPVRIYKPVQSTQKADTAVTGKDETATPTDTHLDTNPNVSVEANRASVEKTSKKTSSGVENGDSIGLPNETQLVSTEQDEQERLRNLKGQEEFERIVAENEKFLEMADRVLAGHSITVEFVDDFLLDLEDGIPEEELRRQIDVYFDRVIPRIVELLKEFPAETQREFSELLLSTVSTEVESAEEAEKLQNRMSESLRTYGIQLPD